MRFQRTPSTRNTVKVANRHRLVFAGVCLAVALIAGAVTFLLINFGRTDNAYAALGNNMGFENNLNEWVTMDGSWSASTTYARTGTRSLKVTQSAGAMGQIKNTSCAITTPASGTNRIVVIAYARASDAQARIRLGIVNAATGATVQAPTFSSISTTGFVRITAVLDASNGVTYQPLVVTSRTGSGNSDIFVDDVHIYHTTLSVVDETAPDAAGTVNVATNGSNITLSWTNGTDAATGIDGIVILRYTGAFTPDQALNPQARYHATSTAIGPTAIGSWKVVYSGNTVTSFTDNPGATGIYTYKIFLRDKAFNYTEAASAARVFVLNGNNSAASISSNANLDGIFIGPGSTLTNGSSSTFTIRPQGIVTVSGTLVHQGTIVNNGTVSIKNGGLYQHNQEGGTVVTAVFETGSTCEIRGVKFISPTNLDQTYHHFIWNNTSQSKQQDLPAGMIVNGNFTLQDSGPGASDRIVWLNGLLTLKGNFHVATTSEFKCRAGSYVLFDGSALQTLQVIGSTSRFNAIEINNSGAGLQLLTNTLIDSLCRMTVGTFDLNNRTFLHANNATIVKGLGAMTNGNFGPHGASFVYNLVYERGNTSGNELTASTAYLNNFSINTPANETVTLDKTANVNGTLSLNGGKVITGSHEIHVRSNNVNAVAINNPNSYVHGNLRRNVLNNGVYTYTFPVGTAANAQLADVKIYNLQGVSNLLMKFTNPHAGANPNCWVNTTNVNTLLNNGYWTMQPNATATAGFFDITLHAKGATNPVSMAQQYAVIKRDNVSSPWKSTGVHNNATQSQSGGIVTAHRGAVSEFGDFAIGYGQAVLPITLATFNATLQTNNTVRISWSTSAEINNAFFSLERSVNGVDFEMINEQEGAGMSTVTLHYAYTDLHPVTGVNYYRLKQVDFDGSFTYGPIRQVTLGATAASTGPIALELNAYPNPGNGLFNIIPKGHAGIRHVAVTDVKGQVIMQQAFNDGAPVRLDLTNHPAGIYLANVTGSDNSSATLRLVVQR